MLERLQFTNFKTWESVDMTLGPVTALFGTNSSGKTSILQFLLLLKQTKDATDRSIALELNGDLVKLGTIADAIHRRQEERSIEFRLDLAMPSELTLIDPEASRRTIMARSQRLTIESEISVRQRAPFGRMLRYRLGSLAFALARKKNGDDTEFDLHEETQGFHLRRTMGRKWPLPGPIKSYAFPDQARTYFQNTSFLSDLESAYESAIDRIYYLGPLRDYPYRDYLWARSRPSDVGQKGERAIDAILAATDAGWKGNLKPKARLKSFQEIIAYWLKEMGLIHSFAVTEIAQGSNRWQARLQTRPGATEVLLTDVGFGVSQVLPVITLLYYVPEGSTVILEQPEIHLHPSAQAHLADVILNVAQHRKVQVIVESHSEHLLLRLQRRIAEDEKGATGRDVKLYFCDLVDGRSSMVPLELDLWGQILNWPRNFMGDAFGETAAAERARLQRMRKTA